MNTLEQRIAKALGEVFDAEPFHTLTAAGLARAVVAVLPTADVSDEAIIEPYWPEMARVIAAVEIEADDGVWTLSPQQAAQIVDALRENRVEWESVVDEPLGVPCSRGGEGWVKASDPVADTREQIYRAAGRVYAEASARYEAAVQGYDWTERKAAHDQLQRAGEMYAKALAGMVEPMTPDEVAAFHALLARGWEALPSVDVDDTALTEALTKALRDPAGSTLGAVDRRVEAVIPAVRALLDAQAAAHAAEVEALRNEGALARAALESEGARASKWLRERESARAEVEALRAEVRQLRNSVSWFEQAIDQQQAIRDRAVREALENAARAIETNGEWIASPRPHFARIVRSLIPEGDTE